MKLSKLRSLCSKAIEKYGDMNVGIYDKDCAQDVDHEEDMYGFKLRILSMEGNLPGEAIDDSEGLSEIPSGYYACLFYED